MTRNARTMSIQIEGDFAKLSRALDGASAKINKFGKSVDSDLGRKSTKAFKDVERQGRKSFDGVSRSAKLMGAAIGAAFVGGAAVRGIGGFISAAEESRKVTKQTEAVLKSMGTQAGMSADSIATLSEKLSLKTGVDDELIQSGQNVLLTFGKVRNEAGKGNDVFTRATKSAVDMSVALGTDLQGANIQLGKALNDPIKGVTALSRAGVSFTQQQKDQIRTLQESGDTLGAQKIILKEMESQFGGSAAAQASAGDKLRVVWGNIQEQLGEKLLPVVDKLSTWFADALPDAMAATERFWNRNLSPVFEAIGRWARNAWKMVGLLVEGFRDGWIDSQGFAEIMDSMFGNTGQLVDVFRTLYEVGQTVNEWVRSAIDWWSDLSDGTKKLILIMAGAAAAFALVASAIGFPITAIAVLVGGFLYAYNRFEWFKDAVDTTASTLVRIWNAGFETVRTITETVTRAITFIWDHWGQDIMALIRTAWTFIRNIVEGYIKVIRGIIQVVTGLIKGDWSQVWNGIKSIFSGVWQQIRAVLSAALSLIRIAISAAWTGIKLLFQIQWAAIKAVFAAAINAIRVALSNALSAMKTSISNALSAMKTSISNAWTKIKAIFTSIVNYLRDTLGPKFTAVKDTIVGAFTGIKDAMSGVWRAIKDAIKSGVNGAIRVVNSLISGLNAVLDRLPGDLHIPTIPLLVTSGGAPNTASPINKMAAGGSVPPFVTNGARAIVGEGDPRYPEYVIPTDPKYRGRARDLWSAAGGNLFAAGGILPDIPGVDAVMGAVRGAGDFIRREAAERLLGPLKSLFDRAVRTIPWDVPRNGVQYIGDQAYNWVRGKSNSQPSESEGGSYQGGAGVERWRGTALQALQLAGQSASWVGDLLRQMQHESGGNPRAINLWDSNARKGTPSMGLMQTILSTFNAHSGHLRGRGVWDPLANIFAAVNYTTSRYGDLGAWRRRNFKGYAQGAWRVDGDQLANIHDGEMIIPSRAAPALRDMLMTQGPPGPGSRTSGGHVTAHFHGITDTRAMARALASEQAWAVRMAG